MRVAFVTLWDGPAFGEMERHSEHNKRRYCVKHGFDYIVYDSTLDVTRPTNWSKIKAVQAVLRNYDWVVWHDTDAVLWNDFVDIRHYLQNATKDFIVQSLHDGINSGIFLLRNCRWSASFLSAIYDQTHVINHPYTEQQGICELVHRMPWKERVSILPYDESQNGLQGYYVDSQWDKLFVHFAGMKNHSRSTLVENFSRLAGYEQHLRALYKDDFPTLLTLLGLLGQGVEVGAGKGVYASLLLDRWRGRRLHLIDAWRHVENCNDLSNGTDEDHQLAYRECVRRVAGHQSRVVILRSLSVDAAREFADMSLDFVRLDANPSFEAARQDIELWWPKVKPGGLLFGTNYLDGELSNGDFGARSAVREFELKERVAAAVTSEWDWPSWYVIKPSENAPRAWHAGHPTAGAIR